MDIKSLNLFIEVMHLHSFTDVAKQHGVAPSSVSRTIAHLENELGFRLFQRSTRNLEPTEAGMIYFEHISPVVEELEAARQIATDINEEPKGKLRITASAVYGQTNIAPLLPELARKYPLLTVELLLTDTYVDLIEERVDVAIRLGSLQDSSYIARLIQPIQFVICASPQYIKKNGTPIKPEDVNKHNCLVFPRVGYSNNWLFKDKKQEVCEVKIQGQFTITNSKAIKKCAVMGMGLALLPDWLVNNDIRIGALTRLYSDYSVTATDYNSGIYILYPSKEYTPLKTRLFIEHLLNNIQK